MKPLITQFDEFLMLSYKDKYNINLLNTQLVDIYIGEYSFIRKTKVSWDFIKLTSGDSLSIPYILIDLFQSFSTYYREDKSKIYSTMSSSSDIELFIYVMLMLLYNTTATIDNCTVGSLEKISNNLETLRQIGSLSTIEYIENHIGEKLYIPGITIITREKTLFL